jgi:hypothetical protein
VIIKTDEKREVSGESLLFSVKVGKFLWNWAVGWGYNDRSNGTKCFHRCRAYREDE